MLQHVSVEVRPADAEACVRFYELLGFEEVEPPGSLAGETTWVQRGPTQVHLLHTDDPVNPPQGHLGVVVDDYDATMDRVRAAGFEADPRPQHWGAPRSFTRDPAGNRVELMAAPPP
jgi:catechol 2,3-dioxygenase-like lactoylglutathione lyase family enzyme